MRSIQGDERGTYSRARTSYVDDPTGRGSDSTGQNLGSGGSIWALRRTMASSNNREFILASILMSDTRMRSDILTLFSARRFAQEERTTRINT